MPFTYTRSLWLRDTDTAGVVYFTSVLEFCHEAYEASLMETGVQLHFFFNHPNQAIPIVHASVDFLKPLHCGDRPILHLHPVELTSNTFTVLYQLQLGSQLIANAKTKHCCIHPVHRHRIPVPADLLHWYGKWQDEPT